MFAARCQELGAGTSRHISYYLPGRSYVMVGGGPHSKMPGATSQGKPHTAWLPCPPPSPVNARKRCSCSEGPTATTMYSARLCAQAARTEPTASIAGHREQCQGCRDGTVRRKQRGSHSNARSLTGPKCVWVPLPAVTTVTRIRAQTHQCSDSPLLSKGPGRGNMWVQ